MKRLFIVLILMLCSISMYSQVIYNPAVEKQNENGFTIVKIEMTDYNTIVYCRHIAPSSINEGNEVTISASTYIQDKATGGKYKLIKVEGIPLSSNNQYYEYSGQETSFCLVFPKVSADCTSIDMIEEEGDNESFNFYGVKLKKINSKEPIEEEPIENNQREQLTKYQREYKYTSVYNPEKEVWSNWIVGINTIVYNINNNGDFKIYYSSGKSEIFSKVTDAKEDYTSGNKFQMIGLVDHKGTEVLLQLFDRGDVKLIYPGEVMVQFTNTKY